MKLDNHLENSYRKSSRTEMSIKDKQEKEKFIFKGSLKTKLGQRVWELDLDTWEVQECKYFTEGDTVNYHDIINNFESVKERKILIREGYDYVVNLNIENAIKSFKRKYPTEEIVKKEEYKSNLLSKNQRIIKKMSNK